jgi:transcriptional regulator with XRE-family HTH domain
LRSATGLSGSRFAQRLGWIQSRVSKIETGKQFPTEEDIGQWVQAAQAPDQLLRLLDLLAQARTEYATWQESYRAAGGAARRQADYAALEAQARRIAKFVPVEVPTQLMTAGYAREHLALASGPSAWGASPADIEDMAAVRLRRQEILSDPGKSVQIVMLEAALYTRLCSPAAMAGQLDRLLAADGLPALELTIVPFTAQVPVYPLSGFVVYDDQLVLVETLTGEQQLNDPEEIARYIGWFGLLRDAGARGRDAAVLIRRALAALTAGPD